MPRPPTALLLLLAACGGEPVEVAWSPLTPPPRYEQDLDQAEAVALAVEEHLRTHLLPALQHGNAARANAILARDARVRLGTNWLLEQEGPPRVERLQATEELLDGATAAERLADLAAGEPGTAELEVDGFWLAGEQALAHFDCHLGWASGPTRVDLRLECRAALRASGAGWVLDQLEVSGGTRLTGVGPRFVEVTGEVGLHYGVSAHNRAMLAEFTDRQQTLALGGLSVLDWNDDGYWDLLGTRRGQLALLFENDGAGGFVPRPLPMEPRQCGSFLLAVDLDGDGRRELVGSEPLGFEGDRAWCGIWRQTDAGWSLDERALTFPNPVGLRRLSIQTVVPCDVQGDGRLDLFFAVYGSALSRGDDYNTVEAHDGADNHLFIQQPDGSFVEESLERGLQGTQYTYVAHAFDFDGDGDDDLFEGNDFGPNVLWLNDGEGRFTADEALGFAGVPAYTMGLTMADLGGDGAWSLYLSNMSSAAGQRIVPVTPGLTKTMRGVVGQIANGNQLYTQDPATGRWTEAAADRGLHEAGWAWACVFWDPDNDGDQDLFVTNGFTSHSRAELPDWQSWYWRQVVADAGFLERGEPREDVNLEHYRPSSFNGRERDRLYQQVGGGTFHEAAWLHGLDADHDGRCAVPVDVDGDGDLDLALWTLQGLRLFENRGEPGRFLRLKLVATEGSPTALGAVAAVTADGRTQRQAVRLTEGFQSQVPDELHFGLGEGADEVARVQVTWPSGVTEAFEAPVGERAVLVQGRAEVRSDSLSTWPASARPRGTGFAPGEPGAVTVTRSAAEEAWPVRDALVGNYPDVGWIQEVSQGAPEAVTVVRDASGVTRRVFRRQESPTRDAEDLASVLDTLADERPFAELCVMSGRLALAEGRFRLAEEYFGRALEADDSRADAHEGLGRVQMIQERPDRAEAAYARAVEVDPDYAIGHFNLGVARIQLGRPAEAIEPLQESLRVTGDRAPALMTLAEAAFLARQPEDALDAWARAAALDPTDPEPTLNRAKLLGQLGRYGEAQAAFEAVLAVRPGHPEAVGGLRRVQSLLDDER